MNLSKNAKRISPAVENTGICVWCISRSQKGRKFVNLPMNLDYPPKTRNDVTSAEGNRKIFIFFISTSILRIEIKLFDRKSSVRVDQFTIRNKANLRYATKLDKGSLFANERPKLNQTKLNLGQPWNKIFFTETSKPPCSKQKNDLIQVIRSKVMPYT